MSQMFFSILTPSIVPLVDRMNHTISFLRCIQKTRFQPLRSRNPMPGPPRSPRGFNACTATVPISQIPILMKLTFRRCWVAGCRLNGHSFGVGTCPCAEAFACLALTGEETRGRVFAINVCQQGSTWMTYEVHIYVIFQTVVHMQTSGVPGGPP